MKAIILIILLLVSSPAYATCQENLIGLTKIDKSLLNLISGELKQRTKRFSNYVYLIIFVESRFNKDAISSAQAVGLMQITAIAAKDVNMDFTVDKLQEPLYNIKVGIAFLDLVSSRNSNNWIRMLIAYNAGQYWANRYKIGKSIPAETTKYLADIFYLKETFCND